MVVIADVAGQDDARERLVKRLPKDEEIVLVGDLVDRGHFSFEVVEWAMKTKRVTTVLGNHEHMMLDYYRPYRAFGVYSMADWSSNGGQNTMASYVRNGHKRPPDSHLDWLANLPLFHWSIDKKCLVTHGVLHKSLDPDYLPTDLLNPMKFNFDHTPIWYRGEPIKRDFFQVFGHNSHWGLREFFDGGRTFPVDHNLHKITQNYKIHDEVWALCIDQSRREVLTAFHWEDRTVIEEPYLVGTK